MFAKEVRKMEEKEKREAAAARMTEEVKKAMENMDTATQERAVGILIGLSANKELIESIKKDSA